MDEEDQEALATYGVNYRLHFIPAGRELVDPLKYNNAVEQAVFGRPGGGRVDIYVKDDGEMEVQGCASNLDDWMIGSQALRRALSGGLIVAYVSNDAGRTFVVDELYWGRARLDIHNRLVDGVGAPLDLVGRQILVDSAHLSEWERIAQAAIRTLNQVGPERPSHPTSRDTSGRADQEAPASSGPRVRMERVERWFREVRCPEYEGERPPNWRQCWEAAKLYFAPGRVVRCVLHEARRNAAPQSWQRSGPNRSA